MQGSPHGHDTGTTQPANHVAAARSAQRKHPCAVTESKARSRGTWNRSLFPCTSAALVRSCLVVLGADMSHLSRPGSFAGAKPKHERPEAVPLRPDGASGQVSVLPECRNSVFCKVTVRASAALLPVENTASLPRSATCPGQFNIRSILDIEVRLRSVGQETESGKIARKRSTIGW